MGTNFYWKSDLDDEDVHIGKRSAAGLYCYDCNRSLCKSEDLIHYTNAISDWYVKCPECWKNVTTTCCSFTWEADDFEVFLTCCRKPKEKIIVDEYGREFTGAEFLLEIKKCKIQFYHLIGKEFS